MNEETEDKLLATIDYLSNRVAILENELEVLAEDFAIREKELEEERDELMRQNSIYYDAICDIQEVIKDNI